MKNDPMTAPAVTVRPSGSAASDAKSLTILRQIEKRAEPTRRATVRRRETMTLRDATIRPRRSAASGARRIVIKPRAERCAEPTIRRATTRRERCADLTRREAMTRRAETVRPSGSARSGAKSVTIRPRIERRAETIRRATIRRVERRDKMIRRATVRRRETSSGRHRRRLQAHRRARRSDLRRLQPAKALRHALRKGRRNAQRLRAGPIINSGLRDTVGARSLLEIEQASHHRPACSVEGIVMKAEVIIASLRSRSRRAMTVQTGSAFRLRPSGR